MPAEHKAPPVPLPQSVGLREAFLFWLKLGFISFGGPAGQISIMHAELVERRRWISEKRFLHALNYCMVLPGPEAQQLATYLGWLMHRSRGGILAGALFVLPSMVLLILLSWVYVSFGHLPAVAGVLYGIKPAVTAIVVHAAWRIGSRSLRNAWLWAIAAAAFIAVFALHAPFPAIIAAAALVGVIGGRFAPGRFHLGGGHRAESGTTAAALIDDDTPTPAHAQFRWSRLSAVIVTGVLLWLVPMVFLAATLGWSNTLTQMGWFFTKAALLTFGGAYAVLPYVTDAAVNHYGWVTPTQMIDALALGETTPGPLIMLVVFVGFVGAHATAPLGPDAAMSAAVAAALLVTWFTFLPSFVFILAGGPMVESTHGDLRFSAPLTAITAAIVGVILNLALYFGYHVLWPQGLDGRFDWLALALAVAAALALFRFEVNVIYVIAACALCGLMVRSFVPQ